MASRETNIPIQQLAENVTMTIHITGLIKFKIQAWIARQLIKLASLILGFGLEIKEED